MIEKSTVKLRLSSEERRATIVESAARLFAEKGFRGTTTRQLAAAAGVSEPVLYEHFKTKDDLYSAIIDAKSKEGIDAFSVMSEQYLTTNDDSGFFLKVGEMILEWYVADPTFIRLLLFSNLEAHYLKDLFHERQAERFFRILSTYIERRIEQGAMRPVDPVLAARAFLGMIAHYALTGLVFQCGPLPQSPNQVVEGMVGIFLGGICKR
ncbi:MAG: TetR/AcrR family transcriptional regulator [Bryobacteraceae bacterium]